jgi:hypothetical protein
MRLSAESSLADLGEDIGYAFFGAAPDLGAFEREYVSSVGIEHSNSQTPGYQQLKIHPNPCRSDYVEVRTSSSLKEVILMDAMGRVLDSFRAGEGIPFRIPVHHLDCQICVIRAVGSNGTIFYGKLILAR